MRTSLLVSVLTLGAVALAVPIAGPPASARLEACDHGDSPLARINSQLDLNDLYVFTSPENPARTVMIATMSPLAGITGSTTFATKSTYRINVDLNGDSVEEDVHSFTFGEPTIDGTQSVAVAYKGRGKSFKSKGTTNQTFTLANGTRCTAGLFDDPCFFDLMAHKAGNKYVLANARNFFRGMNTLAIVIDVANGEFGPNTGLRVWASSLRGKKQIDRVGRPGTSAFLVPGPRRDLFNQIQPKDDVKTIRSDVFGRIVAFRNGNQTGVTDVANALLPDVLPFSLGATTGFAAGNGRKLDDDAIDFTLALVSANDITTDYVANDSAFQSVFPYLAPANP
ncbi:MAG: DUF4331 domain-containing protein [Planctomycetes bacterium]|nr:DUF4331 domain-containing protein [Planctomycetota bacterium]